MSTLIVWQPWADAIGQILMSEVTFGGAAGNCEPHTAPLTNDLDPATVLRRLGRRPQ